MNINTYLKEKLKERNLQVEDLIANSGSSKSTIYRVMTGAQKPSKKLSNKIIEILNLNYNEQQELLYYFSISDVDEYIIEAREAVYHLLFKNETSPPSKVELVYYDNEKFVRTFDDILENVLEASHQPNFSCQFKLINCILDDVITPLSSIIKTLLANKKQYTFDHLINFSTYDFKDNIKVLACIIPLITIENYSLKCREDEHISKEGFFHDFLILNYSYDNDEGITQEMNLYISFLPNNLSACYVVNENKNNLLDFFERNYDSLKENYQPALSCRKTLKEYTTTIINLFRNNDIVLFKSQVSLSRVPASLYKSITERTPLEEFTKFFLQEKHKEKNLETHIQDLYTMAQQLEESTYLNKHLDIYTKSGMVDFASSGLMNDHLEFLPAFNKEEVKVILENIKARDKNPKDPFNFLILNEPYANSILTFATGVNRCLSVEKHTDSNTSFCFIENKQLSAIFTDFAYHYVPAMMSIPQKEAHDFVDYLIETYC